MVVNVCSTRWPSVFDPNNGDDVAMQLPAESDCITLCIPPGVKHTRWPTVMVTVAGEKIEPGPVVTVTSHGGVDGAMVGDSVTAVGTLVGTSDGAAVTGITWIVPVMPPAQCGVQK